MKTITIRWDTASGNPPTSMYFVNDCPVGENNIGFDKILDIIRTNNEIKVILKIGQISSLGGDSLRNSFPFKKRFQELKEALGTNKLIYEFR